MGLGVGSEGMEDGHYFMIADEIWSLLYGSMPPFPTVKGFRVKGFSASGLGFRDFLGFRFKGLLTTN